MKSIALGTALAIVCLATPPSVVLAKGSGGGHGGGQGGHAGGHASGGHGGGRARGSGTSQGRAVTRGTGTTSTATTSGTTTSAGQTSRSRDGRPVSGTAVPRTGKTSPTSTSPPLLVYSPFRVWPYFGGAFGLWGLGSYYDPLWPGYGFMGPYSYGLPSWSPGYPTYGYAPYPLDPQGPTGKLRLKVEPADAEVYVDGYYAGIVDDFDGRFQHLDLTPGRHHVEVRAPGYRPLDFDITVQGHRTVVYRGVLVPMIAR